MTWAHQPPSFGFDQHSPYQRGRVHPQNVAPYPFHLNPLRGDSLNTSPASTPLPHSRQASSAAGSQHRFISASIDTSSAPAVHHGEWKTSQFDRTDNSSQSLRNAAPVDDQSAMLSHIVGPRMEWTESDFPPLGDPKGDRKSGSVVWGERKPSYIQVGNEDQTNGSVPFSVFFNIFLPATIGPRALPLRLLKHSHRLILRCPTRQVPFIETRNKSWICLIHQPWDDRR